MNEEEKNLNEEIEETTETPAEESVEETTEAPAEDVVEETTDAPAEDVVEENNAETPEEVIDNATVEAVEAKAAETVLGGEETELANSDVMAVGEIEDTEDETEETAEDGAAAAAAIETEIAEDGTVTEDAQIPTVTDAVNTALSKTVAMIIGAVILVAIIVLGIIFCPRIFNKYNRAGYIDVSGKTIAEIADNSGMELDEFLESFGLPKDMPPNTAESVAYYYIPCGKIAPMYRMDFQTLKTALGLPDDVTEDTPWGEAEGEATLNSYVGEDNLAAFKEKYGFGDEITGDTKWKEIRNVVDEKQREDNLEQQKAAKEAEKKAAKEAKTSKSDDAEATDAPAETTAEAKAE